MAMYARGRNAAQVGILVLVSGVIFIGFFLWLTDRSLWGSRDTIFVEVSSAEGLKRGDPVLYRGVPVGEVEGLHYSGEAGVLVETVVEGDVPLTRRSGAALVTVDVFGSQAVRFRDGPPGAPALESGDTLPGTAPGRLVERADSLARRVQRLVGDTTAALVHDLLREGREASVELGTVLGRTSALLGEQADELTRATSDMAAVAARLEDATSEEELRRTVARLERTSANLESMTARLDVAADGLASAMRKLDEGRGTAGRLLNDPGLYERVHGAATELEALLRDVRENPRRYVNLSIF